MLVKLGKYDEAEEQYKKAKNKAEKYVYPIIGLGDVCFQKGLLQEAENWYLEAKAIATDPNSPRLALSEIYFKLSVLRKKLNRPDEPRRPYKRLLRIRLACLNICLARCCTTTK